MALRVISSALHRSLHKVLHQETTGKERSSAFEPELCARDYTEDANLEGDPTIGSESKSHN